MSEVRSAFGAARATQLRVLLIASVVIGTLMVLFAAALLVGGDAGSGLVLLVPATALIATCAFALRALVQRGTSAKLGCLAVGALQVLLGVLLTASGLGLLPSIVGILLVLLSLLPDATARTP